MKPLSTLNRPVLRTVDVETKEETVSFKERTDVTAVPGVRRRRRDDGRAGARGRGAAQVRRRLPRRARAQPRRVHRIASVDMSDDDARRHLVLVGLMGAGKTTVGAACATGSPGRSSTPTTSSRRTPACRSPSCSPTRVKVASASSSAQAVADACASPAPARDRVRRRRGARRRQPTPPPSSGVRRVAAGSAGDARGAWSTTGAERPLLDGRGDRHARAARGRARAPRTRPPPTRWSTPTAAPSTRSPTPCSRSIAP